MCGYSYLNGRSKEVWREICEKLKMRKANLDKMVVLLHFEEVE